MRSYLFMFTSIALHQKTFIYREEIFPLFYIKGGLIVTSLINTAFYFLPTHQSEPTTITLQKLPFFSFFYCASHNDVDDYDVYKMYAFWCKCILKEQQHQQQQQQQQQRQKQRQNNNNNNKKKRQSKTSNSLLEVFFSSLICHSLKE